MTRPAKPAAAAANGARRPPRRRHTLPHKASGLSSAPMRSEINVTPLVDVVLVLLIIFMVVTPMISRGVKVDLPETFHHTNKPDTGEQLVVSVAADGRVFIGNDLVPNEDGIIPAMRKVLSGKSHEVHLKGDRTLEYGKVRNVLERINQAGASKVALATDEKKGMSKP